MYIKTHTCIHTSKYYIYITSLLYKMHNYTSDYRNSRHYNSCFSASASTSLIVTDFGIR